ncbi:DNA-binding transcriptional regulator, MarR family [Mucilaginibacter mallensis]|uniref:DNA-binding transcriptional regulator, MarR family n=1 Tax=Mucilaginibacter mallensis TaxID=652787 RepID=A0A1H1SN27_MUCMA|nr:winged helix DNA-binding protein [Mucilaginibacter mallensis]SDS49311.1 DNA-binding transcriptional regulator, MarR family [Mucilaginibacter mallensis]
MNKTVELVNLWAEFEAKYPDGNIDEFCRHYLASRQKTDEEGPLVGGVIPYINDGLLLKIIGRISKLNMNYANLALEGTGLNQIEEFGMLYTIRQEVNPRKTEVIFANLFELSSGTDMLNRMKKRGLISEYDDKEDKRSKRMRLTPEGEKVANLCSDRIVANARMIMHNLSDDDKQLCIQLLKNVEIKFSALWPKHKGKAFEEVYAEITGTPYKNR